MQWVARCLGDKQTGCITATLHPGPYLNTNYSHHLPQATKSGWLVAVSRTPLSQCVPGVVRVQMVRKSSLCVFDSRVCRSIHSLLPAKVNAFVCERRFVALGGMQ